VASEVNPDMYARVFEDHHEGRLIFEDMVKRFGRHPYVPGGRAAERQTLINLGTRKVVDFVVSQINRSHGVNDDVDTHTLDGT
jgi:hypothetical protein